MPANGKRKFKRSTRRKTTTRKPTRTRRSAGPFRTLNTADPFRSSMSVKMHYAQDHVMQAGTLGAVGVEQIYRINSLFDPDFTAGGHQPYAFDQMALLYRKYKVNSVLVEITWSDPTEDGMFFAATFQPPNGSLALAGKTNQTIREQPMSITRSINNSGNQRGKFRQYIKISALSGLSALQFKADIDLFSAVVTNDPAASPFLRFGVGSDRQSASGTLVIKTKITMYSTFYERKVQPPS